MVACEALSEEADPDGLAGRTEATASNDVAPPPEAPLAPDPGQERLAALVARMAAGEEDALSALYDAVSGRVYGLALRICGNAAAAEEVAADVFYQAWRAAQHYDPSRARVLTWLLVICRSRAIDAIRRRDPALPHEAPETLVDEAGDGPESDPLDLLAATRANAALHAALAGLGPQQRQLVGLAFFRGLSHQEIADSTGLPLGTVKSSLRRALETLRQAMAPGHTHWITT